MRRPRRGVMPPVTLVLACVMTLLVPIEACRGVGQQAGTAGVNMARAAETADNGAPLSEPTGDDEMKVTFEGLERVVTFDRGAEPAIAEGGFAITNLQETDLAIRLGRLELLSGDEAQEIADFFVYRLPDYEELDRREISLSGGERLEFVVSFPPIAVHSRSDATHAVRLQLEVAGDPVRTRSPVRLIGRYPR